MSYQISKFCSVLAGLACLLLAMPGVAQITNAPREDFWVPDGVINAMVVTNGVAYVGGDFRYVGPDSGGGVGLDLTTGQPVVNLPRVEGAVYAVASDGQGGRYLGGLFSMVGGLPRRNLAHILADGSVDTQWLPDAIGLGVIGEKEGVHALAVSDGLVYVGGLFNNIAGVARNNLAAVDAITGIATPWSPSPNDDVLCLDVVREVGVIVIGGKFTVIGGQARSYLAAVGTAGTGATTSWFPNPNATILAMARLGDTLYIAGTFTALNNGQVPRSGIAAVNVYTGVATPWAPQANAPVQALAVTCGNGCAGDGSVCSTIFAAGGFTSIGGLNRNYVAALDPFSSAALGWNANISLEISFVGGVSAMLAQGDTIYLGGRFSSVGGQPRSGVAALDTDTARLKPWSPSAGGIVNALNVSGNSLFVGGKTISVGGQARRSLAAIDTATGRLTDWNPTASGVVNALTFNNNIIYIGGTFTNIGGLGRNNLAAVGTNGVVSPNWNPNADSTVYVLAVGASGIYAGGQFWFIGGAYHPGLTYLDFATGAPASSGFAAYYTFIPGQGYYPGVVYSLAVSGNTLFVGGQFLFAGDLNFPAGHRGIAALDANTGQDANANFPGSYDASGQQIGTVYSLSAFNGTLYAGGNFAFIGNTTRSGIAELNPATGVATAWNPSANGPVYSLAPAGADLYVGGAFSGIGGQTRNNLAAINRTTGLANGWDPSASSFVLSLGMSAVPNQLLAGGDFLFLGPRHHVGLGVFPLTGAPTITIQPISQTVPAGTVVQLFVQASGNGVLGYQWRFNGTNISGATSSNLQLLNTSINDTGAYDVRVNNSLGQAVSSPARIVFYTPAAIVTDPVSQDVQPTGQPVVLSVGVTGSPAPTFQWRRNGVNIPGQNLATLTLNGPQSTDGGNFDVVVSNPGGSVKSQAATVRVAPQVQLTLKDAFGQRNSYSTPSGSGFSSNVGATGESNEPSHAGKVGGKSVWMTWVAPFSGIVTFSTSGSTFDTLLAAYTGSTLATLVPVASDDDRGGFGTSRMKFAVTDGQTFAIAVDGLGGTSGDIFLSWQLDGQGSPFVPRIITQPVSRTGIQNQDVTFSVQASGGQNLSYYWLQNCAAIFFATNSTLTVTNPGPAQAGAYRVLINNGFYTILSEPAFLEFGPDPLAVSSDKFEDLIADIPAPSPSLQSDGRPRKSTFTSVSAGIPGTQIFNNFGASTQPGEPLIAGVAGGSSRWFTLRPSTNGTLIVDTIGSDIDTLLGVYRGPSIFSLTNIVSDNNGAPDGIRSRVVFSALKNVDYYIAVDGVSGQQGNIAMNWKLGFTPAITASLTNQYVTRGNGVTFLSSISGSAPLSYQWLSNGVPILNATNASLSLSNVQPANAASYSLSISNLFGTTNTAAATLTVREQMMFSSTNPPSISGGLIQFRVLNIIGMSKVVLEGSTNLVNWVPIKTNNTPPGNFLDLADPVLVTRPYRFYRTKEQ